MSCNFINFQENFPTKGSFIIFILYCTLFVNQGWLVTATQDSNNHYNYSPTLAVFFAEVLKCTFCLIIYLFSNSFLSLFTETKSNLKVAGLYFVPASLYFFYNKLTYVNLSIFDPTTYYMALQLRVVVTGVIFQLIFKKKLSIKQWISLIFLTLGCMLKQVNFGDVPAAGTEPEGVMKKELGISFSIGTLFLAMQILFSCLAGVYNEYLLKQHANDVNLYLQNIFGYTDTIICIIFIELFSGTLQESFTYKNIEPFMNYGVIFVIFNNAAVGIVTSFFLRYLNSILKTFASALELVFTMILSRLLFSIPIYLNTFISVTIVIAATIIYSRNPVVNEKSVRKDDKYSPTIGSKC